MYQPHFEPGDGIEHSWSAIQQWESANDAAEAAYVERFESATARTIAAFDRDELVELIDDTLVDLLKMGEPGAAGRYLAVAFKRWVEDMAARGAA